MRLTQIEIEQIKLGISEGLGLLSGVTFNLYLFGSRVKDNLKGGDIDLLILCEESSLEEIKNRKHILLNRIKKYLGERKIDLTIRGKDQKDPFIESIRADLVKL